MTDMFIADAHLDLAYNALRIGRDLRLPVADLRRSEGNGKEGAGQAIVTLPELRDAGVALVFCTIFVAPAAHAQFRSGGPLVYRTADDAYKAALSQLDYYHRLADEVAYVRLVGNAAELKSVVDSHVEGGERLLGLVPLMEGADPIREPAEAEEWYERGLRIVGPAWHDTRYSGGAWRDTDGLSREGFHLLEVMGSLGFIVDLTHMSERATLQAMDSFEGRVIASHSNVRALVPGSRQLSDEQLRRLIERDGIVGIALANSFLKKGHHLGGPKQAVTLEHVAAHIDHICQLAGNALHAGIGSDFDGGFGLADIPAELQGLADLRLIADALRGRGYVEEDVEAIMGRNWQRLLAETMS